MYLLPKKEQAVPPSVVGTLDFCVLLGAVHVLFTFSWANVFVKVVRNICHFLDTEHEVFLT